MKLWSALYLQTNMTVMHLVSSLKNQAVAAGVGAGLVELGGLSFIVFKNCTSCAGTSANTLFASASRGA